MTTSAAARYRDMAENHHAQDEILEGFRGGRPGAVATVRGWVSSVAAHPGWQLADTESVVQDVLIKLLALADGGGFRGHSSFRTFSISVARHTCIDAYRKQKRRERIEREHAREVARQDVGASGKAERRELLRYVFQKLPGECRRLWNWIYWQGLASRDIAEKLGITETNARVRAHRCLQKARAISRDYLEATR